MPKVDSRMIRRGVTARVCFVLVLASCGTDAVPTGPFDGLPVCTSDTHWKMADQPSPQMYPGVACNECHSMVLGTPRFTIAGTLYPTGHEPDNCNGALGAIVEIVDANNVIFTLEPTNEAGNFMFSIVESPQPAFPFRARVILDGRVRAMTGEVANGDCNSCHTQDGASSAPGRILLP